MKRHFKISSSKRCCSSGLNIGLNFWESVLSVVRNCLARYVVVWHWSRHIPGHRYYRLTKAHAFFKADITSKGHPSRQLLLSKLLSGFMMLHVVFPASLPLHPLPVDLLPFLSFFYFSTVFLSLKVCVCSASRLRPYAEGFSWVFPLSYGSKSCRKPELSHRAPRQ